MASMGKAAVVIVEDNKRAAELLGASVAKRGFSALVFTDAENARSEIANCSEPPVAALLDVWLGGGGTGFDVAETLLERFPHRPPIIVLATGYDPRDPGIFSRIQGMNVQVVEKPIKRYFLEEFLARVAVHSFNLLPALQTAVIEVVKRHNLITSEARIVSCLAKGYTRAELPTQLALSVNTVKFHVRSTLAKTGLISTEQLLSSVLKTMSSYAVGSF